MITTTAEQAARRPPGILSPEQRLVKVEAAWICNAYLALDWTSLPFSSTLSCTEDIQTCLPMLGEHLRAPWPPGLGGILVGPGVVLITMY
jgi:hypothetical protein